VAAPDAERVRQANILRYWRAVEYFSPPQVDRVDKKNRVFAASARWPLPWEPGSELGRPSRNCVWRHTVYAGIFEISLMRGYLLKAFRAPGKEQDVDGRISGQSALLSFAVDESGRLVRDSATLSACGWAVSRTISPGPSSEHWLAGFEDESDALLATLLALGDDRVLVDRNPVHSRGGADGVGARSHLGPIADVTSRLLISAATGAVDGLAVTASAGLGPIAGPVVAKVVNQVGDDLAAAAVKKVVGSVSKAVSNRTAATSPNSAVSDDAQQSADGPSATDGAEPPAEPPRAIGTKVLDVHDLAAITRFVAEELGVADVLRPNQIRIKSYQISAKNAEDAQGGEEILNSFYADDLDFIGDEILEGRIGGALADYLRPDRSLDSRARIDVRQSPSVVLTHLQPSAMPQGRWPAENDQPLALSQQFAINRIMGTLGSADARGLYAVNGPPGTGKTTMLRDLIAALVVRRAEQLAKLGSAEDVFTSKKLKWKKDGGYQPVLNPLRPELTGFEMILASSNNGAVENVTMEVPGAKAVGKSWLAEADYLSGPASLALKASAWGAIAARLGKRSNRSEFVEQFWWCKDGPEDGEDIQASDPYAGLGLDELLRLQLELRRQAAKATPPADPADDSAAPAVPEPSAPLGAMTWSEAKANFKRAQRRVDDLAAARQRICELSARRDRDDPKLWELCRAVGGARDLAAVWEAERAQAEHLLNACLRLRDERAGVLALARDRATSAERIVRAGLQRVEEAERALRAWDAEHRRPGLLRRTLSRGAVQEWSEARAPFVAWLALVDAGCQESDAQWAAAEAAVRDAQYEVDRARATVWNAQVKVGDCDRRLADAVAMRTETEQQVEKRLAELAAERREVDAARLRWGASVPGDDWLAAPDDHEAMERRERSAPWMDEAFAAARTRLFLAALDLHRAVLANAPGTARRCLSAAMEVVKGKAPADLPQEITLAAWQLLFMVVPVVSTTFASVSRMFSGLGPESLGWLLVDEAGQAPPQAVVGALWRAQRAVIVGDPLQLEPVVTLPRTGQARLRRQFDVAAEWLPGDGSVQSRADRLDEYGTWLPGLQGPTWVGSPLRVHRRCDRLMYEVSNTIAYDGMMVYGASETPPDYPILRKNVWLHVSSPAQGAKWNPQEGEYVVRTLTTIRQRIETQLAQDALDPEALGTWAATRESYVAESARRYSESVFVISPFREVVQGLQRSIPEELKLPKERIGTVHKTQGKEADIVILVLGTAAGQSGSRDWASNTPNLVNVAVTRARRRLIVIGDHETWSKHRYFRDLACHPELAVTDAYPW
jgi:hypothetical protein